jgi:hypothetical protein
MSNLHSLQRLLGAAGAGLALCACALPAAAQQAQPDAIQSAQSADAQTVTRDATTGQLRPATAEEQAALAALKAARQARVSPKPTLQKFHSSGASGVRLTDEFLSSSVAVRTPDGKLEMVCNEAHGGQPAAAHVHAAPNTPVTE